MDDEDNEHIYEDVLQQKQVNGKRRQNISTNSEASRRNSKKKAKEDYAMDEPDFYCV